MKKRALLSIVLVQCLLAGAANAAQIAVVNMERLITLHPRTAQDRATLERYILDFDEERDERLAALQQLSEEFESLRQQAEDIGLTPDAVRDRRQRAQLKLEELRRGEAALRELAAQRQQELTNREMRMRERIVRDIKRVLRAFAEERELDLILDGGADPAGGFGAVVFAREPYDVTDDVLLRLRESVEAGAER